MMQVHAATNSVDRTRAPEQRASCRSDSRRARPSLSLARHGTRGRDAGGEASAPGLPPDTWFEVPRVSVPRAMRTRSPESPMKHALDTGALVAPARQAPLPQVGPAPPAPPRHAAGPARARRARGATRGRYRLTFLCAAALPAGPH